eukprot:766828-Pleurochrysis_carterae.AAC.5
MTFADQCAAVSHLIDNRDHHAHQRKHLQGMGLHCHAFVRVESPERVSPCSTCHMDTSFWNDDLPIRNR